MRNRFQVPRFWVAGWPGKTRNPQPENPKPSPLWAIAVALLVFPLLFAQGTLRGLNHDEHQHLAAGYLIATEGLLPYRDFPFFHPPGLPLLYATVFRFGDSLLLEARLISAVAAALTVGFVAWMSLRWTTTWRALPRAGFALAGIGFLLGAPVFAETVGRTSNHDVSVLLALAATACHLAALERPGARLHWFASGLLLALAIGTRVTLAPLVLPFAVALWLWGEPGARLRSLGIFTAGLFVGGLPTTVLFFAAPADFFYGVLEFSQTNLEYRASTGNTQTMTLPTKLRYFFQPILVTHGPLALAFLGSLLLGGWQWSRRHPRVMPPGRTFLLLLLPFILVGALAPSPSFLLYYYALVPFAVLATLALAAPALPTAPRAARWLFAALPLAGIIAVVPSYERLPGFARFREWTPPDVHADAKELHPHLARGRRILTLAPTRPMEAGYRIYPAFATGPFAWRVAEFVDPAKRRRLGLVAPADLERYLEKQRPDAILTGREDLLEAPLIAYARRHGYQPIPIWHGREQLWRKPAPRGHR